MPRLAGVEADLYRAEAEKYAAPLLLLHGLWAEPRIWRGFGGYLAHRGWTSYALSWRGAAGNWRELLTLAQRAADELGGAVAVGHDLGGLAAMALGQVRAAIAIAPLDVGSHTHPFARSWRARVARWRGRPIAPPRLEAQRVLGAVDAVAEPSGWLDELARVELGPAANVPRLLIAGGIDPCLPRPRADDLARRQRAEIVVFEDAGRDLPYGPRWPQVATETHRWLVRRLGESLLLLRGDEDLRDDDL